MVCFKQDRNMARSDYQSYVSLSAEKSQIGTCPFCFSQVFMKLADNQDKHKVLHELDIGQVLHYLLWSCRNVPKFSDRQVWANIADPEQSSLIRVYTLFAIPSASFGLITLW